MILVMRPLKTLGFRPRVLKEPLPSCSHSLPRRSLLLLDDGCGSRRSPLRVRGTRQFSRRSKRLCLLLPWPRVQRASPGGVRRQTRERWEPRLSSRLRKTQLEFHADFVGAVAARASRTTDIGAVIARTRCSMEA